MTTKKHPMQPIHVAPDGVVRFQANAVVEWLCRTGRIDLKEIAQQGFPTEDLMQFAQLLGFSASGFGDLTQVDRIAAEFCKASGS